MASPKTIRANLDLQKRVEKTRAEVREAYAKTHPSLPLTSSRWMGRTKGQPFSRMKLVDTVPGTKGRPAVLVLDHPTRGGRRVLSATPSILQTFFPSLPPQLRASMLGL